MKAKQLYFVLIVVLVLLIGGFFGLAYEANNLMDGQAKKLSKLRADNAVAQSMEATLVKDKADIAKYSTLNKIAETVVPQDKDQAEAVREIVSLASQSGIDKLSSITFPTSNLGLKGAGLSANPDLTQLLPVKGMTGLYELQITVAQASADAIPYDQFTTFLSKLEANRRTAQVSGITVQPDSAHPGNVAFTLVINEFIKP